jgi:hypothetical protein
MPKKLLAAIILIILAIEILSSMSIVTANFMPATTHISIVFSPDILVNSALHYNYQNSTVNLTISVSYVKEGLTEPPKVYFISYSLDGQPLVYLRNPTETNYYYSQYDQDLTIYRATTTIENLSEGNHTIQAYANDISTSRTFTVDSHYVVPVIQILSPTNQTYTSDVPLVFTVNTNFTHASYVTWPKTMDTHLKGQLTGNSTLENLSSGNYVIEVFTTTTKGDHIVASAAFSVLNTNYLPTLYNNLPKIGTIAIITPSIIGILVLTLACAPITIVIVIVAVASILLVNFKRRKGKP